MSLKKALLATVLALPIAATAQAQNITGLYVGAGVGANWLGDAETNAVAGFARGDVSFDLGYGGVLALGWGFGNGLRAEVEANFRSNDVDSMTVNGLGGSASGGTARSYGGMLNVLYDFNTILGVRPYVGAGVGYAIHQYDNVNTRGTNGRILLDGDSGNFAYQAIVGAALPITPALSLTAEYRFFATLDADIDAKAFNGAGVQTGRNSASVENLNHSLFVGVRYWFGAPAPAAAAAAAPAPARTFLVFFDWNRDNLTDRARAIIAEAAQAARRTGTTRIEVAGHADRTGTAQYNQRLSERRAENVAAELVRNGIGRNEITTVGFGFDRPLVPTAAGVREPQNRRVEIVLR